MAAPNKSIISLLLAILAVTFSCKEEKASITKSDNVLKRVFDDPIEDSLKSFWYTHQIAHPERLEIIEDTVNIENDILKLSLHVGDNVAGGTRSEIIIKPQDSFGYRNNYSFKFMFPKGFFKIEKELGYILLHQWHDLPFPGFTYRTSKIRARVPFALYLKHQPGGTFELWIHYGLKVGAIDKMIYAKWPVELETDVWYTFENEIFWSLYDDGYAMPKLNDLCFKIENNTTCELNGANMYHTKPNDYKMGLYSNGVQAYNRYIFYDEFRMTSQRISYFPQQLNVK